MGHICNLPQGLMKNHEQIVEYFIKRGVSVIFLFRRNLLRRMVSILANQYDKDAKLLNGTHKSHVHSHHEVSLSLSSLWILCMLLICLVGIQGINDLWRCFQAETLAKYKPTINTTSLISELRQVNETTTKALEYFKNTRHIVIYYEDVVRNRAVCHTKYLHIFASFSFSCWAILWRTLPRKGLNIFTIIGLL